MSTAILENSDGRLFPVTVSPDRLSSTDNNGLVYFSGIDCTGTAYLDAAGAAPSLFEIGRTVIARPGTTVYTATGPTLTGVSWRSQYQTDGQTCFNADGTLDQGTEAEVISRWAGLQPPFSVRRK